MSHTDNSLTLSETDLILILDVLNDSFDDTNNNYLAYKKMYENSPARKAKIEAMNHMVDKHAHAIDLVESLLRNR